MLPGLHAALVSLARSNPDLPADVFVFGDKVRGRDKTDLHTTWRTTGNTARLHIEDYSPVAIGNSLHGSATAYGRCYLGELLPDVRACIYLDCDLIINSNLTPLFDRVDADVLLLADCEEWCKDSLDWDLYQQAGLSADSKCFNSGVLAFNLDAWRRGALERCRAVALQYPGQFRSADQAMLNVAFHAEVAAFGSTFNTPLYPTSPSPSQLESKIYHFVGSPKPWDPGGRNVHNSADIWHAYFLATAIGKKPLWRYWNARRITRTSRQVWSNWLKNRRAD